MGDAVHEKGRRAPNPAEEFEDWGSKTTLGVLAGMLYGGSKEALSSAHLGKILGPLQEGKDLKTKRFMWREMMEQRVIGITKGSVIGGARLGAFTALFCGVQSSLAVNREVHDTWNVVVAGSVTAASFGFALPGSFISRARAAAVGSMLGAAFCLPLGYLQSSLQQQVEEVQPQRPAVAPLGKTERDGISATIRQLEQSLSESEAVQQEKQRELKCR